MKDIKLRWLILLSFPVGIILSGCSATNVKEVGNQYLLDNNLTNKITTFCGDTGLFGIQDCPVGTVQIVNTETPILGVPLRLCLGVTAEDMNITNMICIRKDIIKGK